MKQDICQHCNRLFKHHEGWHRSGKHYCSYTCYADDSDGWKYRKDKEQRAEKEPTFICNSPDPACSVKSCEKCNYKPNWRKKQAGTAKKQP